METALVSLIAASIAFVGGHFAMSHPLRPAMVRILGPKGFDAVYSLISIATVIWMYFAFKAAPASTPLWTGFDDVSWAIGSVIALPAMVLLAGSFVRNPAIAMPGAEAAAREAVKAGPHGVFAVTRHPMMWGFALWAISHLIAAPTARTLVVASAVLILALIGARLQDRKKRVLMGDAWVGWESATSYWPRFAKLFSAGLGPWVVGVALWLGLSWLHNPLGGWDAGIWRWL